AETGRQPALIGTDGHANNPFFPAWEHDTLRGLQVPEACAAIVTPGRQPAAVRTKANACHSCIRPEGLPRQSVSQLGLGQDSRDALGADRRWDNRYPQRN